MHFKKILLILVLMFLSFFAWKILQWPITTAEPQIIGERKMDEKLEEIRKNLENGNAQLFDVREEDEWDEGHLEIAKFVPLSGIETGSISANLDKSKKTYLHCRTGRRVLVAEQLLTDMGFQNIVPMQEGFDELVMEGFKEAE